MGVREGGGRRGDASCRPAPIGTDLWDHRGHGILSNRGPPTYAPEPHTPAHPASPRWPPARPLPGPEASSLLLFVPEPLGAPPRPGSDPAPNSDLLSCSLIQPKLPGPEWTACLLPCQPGRLRWGSTAFWGSSCVHMPRDGRNPRLATTGRQEWGYSFQQAEGC